jgi:flagellar basal body P-ring formation protein FlgA
LTTVSEPAEPTGPTLRREATVVGEIVRIGDLVENAGVVAEVPIFRAPDLGQTGSVSTAGVIAAVRQHHIIWLDTRGLDEVLVTRAARMVTAKDIEARLLRTLAGQVGANDLKDLSVSFDGEVRSFHVEPTAEPTISRLSYDPRSRRFDVTFDVPARAGRRTPLRVTGALVETVEAVVTLRNIPQGEVIKASDVMIERRPKTEVIAIEDVLGFAAKHALRAAQVIRASDVTKPELVARNGTVTITYEAPGMVLSIRGQALEGGALGDVINVINVQSKRTFQATVTAPGRVTVTATPPRKVAAAEPAAPQR